MLKPSVLITGFGPFPGVPVNASGVLATRLAAAARRRFSDAAIHAALLPTEWDRGPARAARWIARLKPSIVLHFGVSSEAAGFVIERRAVNACVEYADGAGLFPALTVLDPDGPKRRMATLPVRLIVTRLRALGLPATASDDAGMYLCNAVLYGSLGSASDLPLIAGFVHLPASLATGASCPMTPTQALAGGLEIIATCLETGRVA
jgi:pyroglutamyl-peptidase